MTVRTSSNEVNTSRKISNGRFGIEFFLRHLARRMVKRSFCICIMYYVPSKAVKLFNRYILSTSPPSFPYLYPSRSTEYLSFLKLLRRPFLHRPFLVHLGHSLPYGLSVSHLVYPASTPIGQSTEYPLHAVKLLHAVVTIAEDASRGARRANRRAGVTFWQPRNGTTLHRRPLCSALLVTSVKSCVHGMVGRGEM